MRLNKFFDGKVIWITGASQGLGRELAISLSQYNVRLILSARNDLKLRETKQLTHLPEHRVLIVPMDLTHLKDEQVSVIAERILLKFGALDILIHNASISQRSMAHQTLEPVERQIMETNFFGPVALTKAVLPHLLKSESPQIAIISSLAGKFGVPLRSTYSAAKHALHGFFEAMLVELYDKLDISFFVLGGVRTESAKNALSADGSLNNKHDIWHDHNMPADKCADEIVKRLPKKRGEFVIGGLQKLGLFLKNNAPHLHQKLMLKFFSKEKKNFSIK